MNSELDFIQFAGYVRENNDRHKIHKHQHMIDTKGKIRIHSIINSLTNRGNIHFIISMDHLVFDCYWAYIYIRTKIYKLYHYRFDGFV